ncbi:NADH dehydrogenase [ubiquinone] flavoprotein 3, mitochondrial [Gastrophryne carolinensis]
MAAAPTMRAIGRLRRQVLQLQRIAVSPSRPESGGGASTTQVTPPPPAAAPAPTEPFDNSKYQNEQHFSYTPFTFVDYDLELAGFRLPQPSSGRPSPRH